MKTRVFWGFLGALFLLILVLCLLPMKELEVEGNGYYSAAEIRSFIYGKETPKALRFHLQQRFGKHRELPFVEKYSVSFTGFCRAKVRVYEKTLAGYLAFQDYYLYFDWDGILIESSSRRLENLFEVEGLPVAHAVLGEPIAVEDERVFRTVLTLGQYLSSESIELTGKTVPLKELAEKIRFTSAGVSVVFGRITVLLGDSSNLEQKLFLMSDMLPTLWGREGTLYLDSYREGEAHPQYIFR